VSRYRIVFSVVSPGQAGEACYTVNARDPEEAAAVARRLAVGEAVAAMGAPARVTEEGADDGRR
jgi:hypothetical protein